MRSILLLLFSLTVMIGSAQNVYEILISSYANARELKDVTFEVFQGEDKIIEQVSKNGMFQFVLLDGNGEYKLSASKEGYFTKVIHFRSDNYPFANEYEIQEINIEFHKSSGSVDEEEVAELKWNSLNRSFNLAKYDENSEAMVEEASSEEVRIMNVYNMCIKKGEEALDNKDLEHAKSYFELAIFAKPYDEYASRKLSEINETGSSKSAAIDKEVMEKINRGEISQVPNAGIHKGVIYSVQLGAYKKKITEADFPGIPDFKAIQYTDYTRIFSGEFNDINLAIQRRKEMISKGFKDAWIVQMKGNERIGF